MNSIYLFFIALFLLFFLARALTRALSSFLFNVTGKESIALRLLWLILLPGIFVHEASHYLMAVFLRVRVGEMEFVPRREGNSVKMGSVKVAKTDPLRRLLIGVSPLVFGTVIIFSLLSLLMTNGLNSDTWILFFVGYAVFVVGNTMYSSRRDLEGAVYFFIVLFVFLSVFYFLDIKFPDIELSFVTSEQIQEVFLIATKFLLVPIVIDIFILFALRFLRRFFML